MKIVITFDSQQTKLPDSNTGKANCIISKIEYEIYEYNFE